jgi:hypothetical protein
MNSGAACRQIESSCRRSKARYYANRNLGGGGLDGKRATCGCARRRWPEVGIWEAWSDLPEGRFSGQSLLIFRVS